MSKNEQLRGSTLCRGTTHNHYKYPKCNIWVVDLLKNNTVQCAIINFVPTLFLLEAILRNIWGCSNIAFLKILDRQAGQYFFLSSLEIYQISL